MTCLFYYRGKQSSILNSFGFDVKMSIWKWANKIISLVCKLLQYLTLVIFVINMEVIYLTAWNYGDVVFEKVVSKLVS